MQTKTLFITKDNWSGESAQLKVTEFAGGFEWEQDGYKIELTNRKRYDEFVCYDIHIDGQFMDEQVGKSDDDTMWEATTWNGEMTRQASNDASSGWGQVAAAAKLLFNTL